MTVASLVIGPGSIVAITGLVGIGQATAVVRTGGGHNCGHLVGQGGMTVNVGIVPQLVVWSVAGHP